MMRGTTLKAGGTAVAALVVGPANDRRVVVALTPEMSGFVIDEPTTVAYPVDWVRPAVTA